ncbi:hypothetical protein TIFTF001_019321 [Ficus carica]|uniref:NAD-dependent epimerase/dehydratase domain-containing protein n=1 Tax=Ficus carica TaxID=3494 RepID=A0AA88DBN2_FICCA|nr:hypothetical protein TIFTF001_019321 [Ficus carica]
MDRKTEIISKGKVCVTGASGFLASWLVKRLLLSGYHVVGTVRDPVITSSSSTVRARDDFDPKIPVDESTWSSVELCEKLQIWYPLSKTLAEKAAWEFCNKNSIDLVTVLPAFVIGPSLPPYLCSTASDVLGLLKGNFLSPFLTQWETEKFQFHGRMGYVHIDDVAASHILVYEHKDAHGRYLCSSTVLDNNELVSFLSTRYPSLPIPKRFEELNRPYYDFNTLKLRSLGFKFKTIDEMFDDCIASFVEQGHLPPL